MSQLAELAKPFRPEDIRTNPSGGGEYVKHSTAVGPFDYRIVEIIRGDVPGKAPNPNGKSKRAKDGTPALVDAVVGCLAELTLTIDGRRVSVTEVGDCEEPHNWPHDGARLKDASSDALKRAAMRFSVGLHLWSQDSYRLHGALEKRESVPDSGDVDGGKTRSTTTHGLVSGAGVGVAESPSTNNLTNTGENDTESSDQPVGGGVVREAEPLPSVDVTHSGVPDSGSGIPPTSGPSSARRRLDRAKGHA